jgi:hypothetical protein
MKVWKILIINKIYKLLGAECDENKKMFCKTFLTCRLQEDGKSKKCIASHIGKYFLKFIKNRCKMVFFNNLFSQYHSDCWLNSPDRGDIRCINNICERRRYAGYQCFLNEQCKYNFFLLILKRLYRKM